MFCVVWVYHERLHEWKTWSNHENYALAAREARRLRKLCPTLRCRQWNLHKEDLTYSVRAMTRGKRNRKAANAAV